MRFMSGRRRKRSRERRLLSFWENNNIPFEFLSETHLLFSGECNIIRLKSLIEDFGADQMLAPGDQTGKRGTL